MSTVALLQQALEALTEATSSKAQFTGWSCESGPAELVDWLVDRGREVTYRTFAKHAEIRQLPSWWEGMARDWSATYLKTELPSGKRAWVAQHSGIEYLFTERGRFDHGHETELADKLAEWLAEHPKYNWASDIPRNTVQRLRRQL